MGFLLTVLRAGGVIFMSLVLAAVALVYVGIEHPSALEGMLVHASQFKEVLTDTSYTGLDVRYNVWVKFLLQEQLRMAVRLTLVTILKSEVSMVTIRVIWRRQWV